MKQGNLFITLAIPILILVLMLFLIPEKPIPHDHVFERYYYAGGVKSYQVEYCMTDSVQVIFSGEHKSTLNSYRYFNESKMDTK